MSKDEIITKVHELIEAPSCCSEAKEAGNAYLKAVGTADEKAAAKTLIAELEEDVTPIDALIAFTESEQGSKIFGAERAKSMAEQGHKVKNAGGKYCFCPACTAGAVILENKDAIL